MAIPQAIQSNVKAVLTFVLTVVVNASADWMAHGAPVPESWRDAIRWFLTIVASTLLVYYTPNRYTVAQAQVKLDTAQNRVEDGKQAA